MKGIDGFRVVRFKSGEGAVRLSCSSRGSKAAGSRDSRPMRRPAKMVACMSPIKT